MNVTRRQGMTVHIMGNPRIWWEEKPNQVRGQLPDQQPVRERGQLPDRQSVQE